MSDDQYILHSIAFAVGKRRRDLAELAKPHPLDHQAGMKVAKAVVEHLRLSGYDIVKVKPPSQFMPPDPRKK